MERKTPSGSTGVGDYTWDPVGHKGQHTCDWTPAEERTLGGSHFYRMREFPQIDEVCQTTISRNVTNLKQNKYKENPTFIPME